MDLMDVLNYDKKLLRVRFCKRSLAGRQMCMHAADGETGIVPLLVTIAAVALCT